MAQRRKRVSHARELYYIVFILGVVLLGAFTIWGPNGYTHLANAQKGLETRQSSVDALKRSNSEKVDVIRSLKYDRETVEKYAREKGGYAREGEIIQHVGPNKKSPK